MGAVEALGEFPAACVGRVLGAGRVGVETWRSVLGRCCSCRRQALDKGGHGGLGEKWPDSRYGPAGIGEPPDGLGIGGEREKEVMPEEGLSSFQGWRRLG